MCRKMRYFGKFLYVPITVTFDFTNCHSQHEESSSQEAEASVDLVKFTHFLTWSSHFYSEVRMCSSLPTFDSFIQRCGSVDYPWLVPAEGVGRCARSLRFWSAQSDLFGIKSSRRGITMMLLAKGRAIDRNQPRRAGSPSGASSAHSANSTQHTRPYRFFLRRSLEVCAGPGLGGRPAASSSRAPSSTPAAPANSPLRCAHEWPIPRAPLLFSEPPQVRDPSFETA